MGSIQAQTESLGPTVVQMIPMLFNFLIDIPIALSFGNTNP